MIFFLGGNDDNVPGLINSGGFESCQVEYSNLIWYLCNLYFNQDKEFNDLILINCQNTFCHSIFFKWVLALFCLSMTDLQTQEVSILNQTGIEHRGPSVSFVCLGISHSSSAPLMIFIQVSFTWSSDGYHSLTRNILELGGCNSNCHKQFNQDSWNNKVWVKPLQDFSSWGSKPLRVLFLQLICCLLQMPIQVFTKLHLDYRAMQYLCLLADMEKYIEEHWRTFWTACQCLDPWHLGPKSWASKIMI